MLILIYLIHTFFHLQKHISEKQIWRTQLACIKQQQIFLKVHKFFPEFKSINIAISECKLIFKYYTDRPIQIYSACLTYFKYIFFFHMQSCTCIKTNVWISVCVRLFLAVVTSELFICMHFCSFAYVYEIQNRLHGRIEDSSESVKECDWCTIALLNMCV